MDLYSKTSVFKNTVCSTCLSRGRNLYLANKVEEISKLFPKLVFGQNDRICWECKGMSKKLMAFKNRTYKAQMLFHQVIKSGEFNSLQSLSHFSTVQINSIFCHSFPLEDPFVVAKDEPEEAVPLTDANMDCDSLCEDLELAEQVVVEEPTPISPELDLNEDLMSESEIQPTRKTKKIITGDTFYYLVPAQKVNIVQEPTVPSVRESLTAPKDLMSLPKATASLPAPAPAPVLVPQVENKRLHFDTRTGKYHEEMFKTISLTEGDMLETRLKKLNCGLFKNSLRKCMTCIIPIATDSALEKHMVKHKDASGMFECSICKLRWFTQELLDEHIKSHYRCFKCLLCNHKTMMRTRASEHYHNYHHVGTFKCKDCPEKFTTVSLLQKHRYKDHFAAVQCPHCKTTHKNVSTLDKHIAEVHKDVPLLKCSICLKKYRSSASLTGHITRTHRNNKAGEAAFCVECGIQFSSVSSYQTHIKKSLKHISVKDLKYECDHCGKKFSTKCYLRTHLDTHMDTKDFKCDQCGSAFKNAKNLRTHVRQQHEKRNRKHACHICPKAYYDKHTLDQHLNAHRGYRPFVCEICSADFSHTGSLYKHKQLKHGYIKKK